MLVYYWNKDIVFIQNSSEYSEFNSQLWKDLNITSISVTSIKKTISRLLEDSAQFKTLQKSDLQLTIQTA
jgi:hypothetical protein